jgi:LPS export ABC transporter protein LptC
MHTEETLHYPDKSARLKTVHVASQDGPDGVWQLDALHGQIAPSQETVLLTDGVRIHSEMQDGPMVITTPEATVDLKGKHITSMEAVTVESPGYHAQALGMEAGFRSRDLTLLKDVQSGIYAKP